MENDCRLIDANTKIIDKYFHKRLIDCRDFVKECNHFYENPPFPHPSTPWHKGLQLAVEIAMRLPTVDAVEVVHGRWENVRILLDDGARLRVGDCSRCESTHKLFNYCPNCGADMRERKDNE